MRRWPISTASSRAEGEGRGLPSHGSRSGQDLPRAPRTPFCECHADDVKVGKRTAFPRSVKLKTGETVAFSWITFRLRKDRDRVNARVPALRT